MISANALDLDLSWGILARWLALLCVSDTEQWNKQRLLWPSDSASSVPGASAFLSVVSEYCVALYVLLVLTYKHCIGWWLMVMWAHRPCIYIWYICILLTLHIVLQCNVLWYNVVVVSAAQDSIKGSFIRKLWHSVRSCQLFLLISFVDCVEPDISVCKGAKCSRPL